MTKPTRLRRQRNSKSIKDMYTLLDRFSDIVLFEYNSREDILHFTPNVQNMFKIDNLEIHKIKI